MFAALAKWIESRRRIRRRWQQDARVLIVHHGLQAYYEAQRLAARSRALRDKAEFWHWAKVASEVARLSPRAEMDVKVVQAIVDEELQERRHP